MQLLICVAEANFALGRYEGARDAYRACAAISVELSDELQHEAQAGLARIALAEGDVDEALRALGNLPDRVMQNPVPNGVGSAGSVYLICHEVLAAVRRAD